MGRKGKKPGRAWNGNAAAGQNRQPGDGAGRDRPAQPARHSQPRPAEPQQPMLPSTFVTSPSRFARIPRFVHYPKWGPLVSHDVPFKDGHNGEITITITAKTPLMVGRARDKSQEPGIVLPFRAPDGSYAIPGSALQGMMRSILTVATFGKLGPAVHNRRYAVRDIGGSATAKAVYGKRMTKGGGRDGPPIESLVKTGWLVRARNGKHRIVSCEMARIEMNEIAHGEVLRRLMRDGTPESTKKWKDADARYREFLGEDGLSKLDQDFFWPEDRATRKGPHDHSCGPIIYEKCQKSRSPSSFKGTLILTGKASSTRKNDGSRAGSNKHMEFVFHNPSRAEIIEGGIENFSRFLDVPTSVWHDFLLIHEPESGSGEEINPNWAFWKDEFKTGSPVPVFYLEELGEVKAMGTAQMFKLAMPLSTHDMLANSSPEHISTYDGDARPGGQTGKLDLPSLIFGATGGKQGDWFRHNLKRRASFDMARIKVEARKPESGDRIGPVAMLSPKPSYYPIYVRQPQQGNRRQHPDRACYATYTGLSGQGPDLASPELSGVKIWPAEGRLRGGDARWRNSASHRLSGQQEEMKKVLSWLDAVPEGSSFTTKLRIHNLREVELGALLWALSFGKGEAFTDDGPIWRHRLGGGKPYGLGEVEIRIQKLKVERNDREPVKSGQEIVNEFVRYMDELCGRKWVESNQVESLLKAAEVTEYRGSDALEYVHGAVPKDSGKRHADLRNGWGPKDHRKPGGHFLPVYVDNGWEKPRAPLPAANNHRGGQAGHAPRQAPPAAAWPAVEDAPVRHRDGREGIIREVTHTSYLVSVSGNKETWPRGTFVVTGPADE